MSNVPILIVEDDILCGLETCDALRDYGFDVQHVGGSAGAYSILDKHEPLRALVTDVDLGPGDDGYAIAKHARSLYPDLPVIYLSASSPLRQLSDGVNGSRFICKPFFSRQVAEQLFRMLHLNQTAVGMGC